MLCVRYDVVEKADVRLAAGGKIPGKAEVDPGKNGIHNITADVLAAHQHHGGVGGEAPQQRLGHKLNDQYYGNAVTAASMEDGTMNMALMIFSTMPTAAESIRPRWLAMMVIMMNAT